MYLPARVWSQQSQDSRFRMGILHILAGHSGPETAADARTHFGIFAPQVWKLFPRGQAIHLSFWDYNDVAPDISAAAEIAARDPKVGVIIIEVARPDFPVADRDTFADKDLKAAAQRVICYPRLPSGPTQTRLRDRSGIQFHRQPRKGNSAPGSPGYQRENYRRCQRRGFLTANRLSIANRYCLPRQGMT